MRLLFARGRTARHASPTGFNLRSISYACIIRNLRGAHLYAGLKDVSLGWVPDRSSYIYPRYPPARAPRGRPPQLATFFFFFFFFWLPRTSHTHPPFTLKLAIPGLEPPLPTGRDRHTHPQHKNLHAPQTHAPRTPPPPPCAQTLLHVQSRRSGARGSLWRQAQPCKPPDLPCPASIPPRWRPCRAATTALTRILNVQSQHTCIAVPNAAAGLLQPPQPQGA
jgi:hypothetical protein